MNIAESTKQAVPTAMTLVGGGGAAAKKYADKVTTNPYEDGSFAAWIYDNAIVLGVGVAVAGLVLTGITFTLNTLIPWIKARKAEE